MLCPDAGAWSCSGDTILRTEPYNIAVLRSGVQAYGKAAVDLESAGAAGVALGLVPASGGTSEFRILKTNGITADPGGVRLMLRNLGLSFTGAGERPPIIEVFRTNQGRSLADAGTGIVTDTNPLPPLAAFNGTDQAAYVNNRYFPMVPAPTTANTTPSCILPVPAVTTPCPNVETTGLQFNEAGSFRPPPSIVFNATPDQVTASRLHEDGDRDIPSTLPLTYRSPGSKGVRFFQNYGYQYANVAAWFTDDIVNITGWRVPAATFSEHTKNRRGTVAYGAVTDPTTVPAAGTVAYSETQAVNPLSGEQSRVWAWYTPDGSTDPVVILGKATVVANFDTRLVTVEIRNMLTFAVPPAVVPTLPASFTITMAMGNVNTNTASYMTGAGAFNAASQTLNGGMSARFFGPVAGGGPAEVGGTFSLSSTTGAKATIIGGFVAKK